MSYAPPGCDQNKVIQLIAYCRKIESIFFLPCRFQIQGGPNNAVLYNSYLDCVRTMARAEGSANSTNSYYVEIIYIISIFLNRALSFYKGIVPPLFAETPKRAMKVYYNY